MCLSNTTVHQHTSYLTRSELAEGKSSGLRRSLAAQQAMAGRGWAPGPSTCAGTGLEPGFVLQMNPVVDYRKGQDNRENRRPAIPVDGKMWRFPEGFDRC